MPFVKQQCIYKNFLLTALTNSGHLEAEKALGEVFMRLHNGKFATHIDPEKPRKVINILFEEDKEKLKPYWKEIRKATDLLKQKYSDEKFEREVLGVRPASPQQEINERQMVLF